jgi:hypothetical protein
MRKELLVVSPIISMGLLKLGHSQSLLHESRLSRQVSQNSSLRPC